MAYTASTNWANEEKYLNGLISSGTPGQSAWAQNQLGVLNAAKESYSPVNIDSSIGNFSNALDVITGISDKVSAKSLDFAQQQQDWSANQAKIANEYSAAEAAKNRDWQEYMSNTAHQREVADLKAAGLNPILSAQGGNGAAVTSGATASASLPSGSSASADNSSNAALVQLLGSLLSAQTAIANQAVSARTQESVADKYTAMSYLTAQMAAAASRYGSDRSAGAAMYSADQHRAASEYGALMGLTGTQYSSDSAKATNDYKTLMGYLASLYGSDKSYAGTKYSADKAAGASIYGSDKNFKGRLYQELIDEGGDLLGAMIEIAPDLFKKHGKIGF